MNPVKYRQLTVIAEYGAIFEDYLIDVADKFEEEYLNAMEAEDERMHWDAEENMDIDTVTKWCETNGVTIHD